MSFFLLDLAFEPGLRGFGDIVKMTLECLIHGKTQAYENVPANNNQNAT